MRRVCVFSWWWVLAALLPAAGQVSLEEKPRAAVVNIQKLFRSYYKSQLIQEQINVERARIQKDHNDTIGRLRSMDEGLRHLEARLQNPNLGDSEREALLQEKGLRFQEREALDKQRRDLLAARHGDLNKKMMLSMEGLLEEIREIVAEKAERNGFDLVFDVEGLNTSQVPFLLFAKDATDITPMILKELNKNAPVEN